MKRIILGMTALVLLLSTLAGCGKKEDLTTVSVNEVTHSVFYALSMQPWSWASLKKKA